MNWLTRLFKRADPIAAPSFGGAGATASWDTIPPASRRPRGIRNNNPGNIRGTANGRVLVRWQGQVSLDPEGFCIFASPELGIRALAMLLLVYQARHGLRTIREIIDRWAPPAENDTGAYVAAVAGYVALPRAAVVHLRGDRYLLEGLCRAIIKHENGIQPYAPAIITSGVTLALQAPP
jgi:hypothetical protein